MRVRGQGYLCWECWFMRLAPRLHQRYLSWWIDRHRKLGSDETGAKPADGVRARVVAPSSASADSSQSREARHGVAQALVDKVRVALNADPAISGDAQRAHDEGFKAVDALLRLIDELADRLYAATAASAGSRGVDLIAVERQRQIIDERWDARHDDRHKNGSMAIAASAYAYPDRSLTNVWDDDEDRYEEVPEDWPWEPRFWKPTPDDRIRELVKAGALVAAEIDRLIRAGGEQ